MRFLKFGVILGGILLLVGFGLLFKRMMSIEIETDKPSKGLSADTPLELPVSGKVISVTPHSYGSMVLVETGGGRQDLLIIKKNGEVSRHLYVAPVSQQ
ncbi:MAG: hypothetical protein HQL54_07675 [Magnetococcales bacterium]|nr:hypothetical protein [Magnetococcales bacterium]